MKIARRKIYYSVAVLVVLLVVAHVSLPFVLHWYVQRTLNKINGYRANIGLVTVNLFRGAYAVRQVKLEKTSGRVPVPFFSADAVDLSVEWKQLFHGAVVGQIGIDRPTLNFVNSPTPEAAQTSIDKDWMRRVKQLFPLKINRFEIFGGDIHFRDFSRQPNVDLFMTNVHVVAVNLTNSRRLSKSLMAVIDATGYVPPTGSMKLHLEANPFASKPTFSVAAEMTDVQLTQWNDFLRAYGGVDAAKGSFSVYTEMKVNRGNLQGYIKPIFKDVEIARWKEHHESVLKVVWKKIVAGVAEALKNQPKNQIATRIPLNGDLENPNPGILATVGELLRNAFIQALFPGLEGFVH